MGISVKVDTSKLDALIAKTPGNKDRIVTETAFHALGSARERAPVRTGHLRDNSDVTSQGAGKNVNFNAEYAGYVEFGTWKMGAQPFLKPAIEAEAQLFIERLKGLVK